VSRTGLSPSYLGCGRLTTEGYGSARRERVHGPDKETPILPAPVIREKSQFRAQHDSLIGPWTNPRASRQS
jgi:hypothetical protein